MFRSQSLDRNYDPSSPDPPPPHLMRQAACSVAGWRGGLTYGVEFNKFRFFSQIPSIFVLVNMVRLIPCAQFSVALANPTPAEQALLLLHCHSPVPSSHRSCNTRRRALISVFAIKTSQDKGKPTVADGENIHARPSVVVVVVALCVCADL